MLFAAIQVELKKLLRAKILPISFIIFIFIPFIGGFFMMILKDPVLAKSAGIISAKANLVGNADWPSYFGFLSQAISVGGLIVFGFMTSWIFGREYSDKTIKDLLALPISRIKIVAAKYIALSLWMLSLGLVTLSVALPIGKLLVLPSYSISILTAGSEKFLICFFFTMLLSTPVGFASCLGKGFLAPLGFLVFTVASAEIIAVMGYGEFYPWAVPALLSEMAGPSGNPIGFFSFFLVLATSALGVYLTFFYWTKVDQF